MRQRSQTRRRPKLGGGASTRLRSAPTRRSFHFEELDEVTRDWMLLEFREEQRLPHPYRSNRLTDAGLEAWIPIMEIAISEGDETSLAESLRQPSMLRNREPYKKGYRAVPWDAHYSLAITEFNTWYVRGLARRLIEEGVPYCEAYRAAPASEPRAECEHLEEQVFLVQHIYEGHRARYWPEPGDQTALSIPVGVNCHHTIRRHPANYVQN